ncbi:U3 small nucleolar RNA-associated protein 22 [[Candida] railenensis]|uniref:U3 small nucleolar RNA-associated protein 22 n=1 Tax=[Candida] railenensis TaxID=45579 RepID=A0A9P0W1A3_9ASCO|nr:U3 small nucleolar RNA-associated protein 22 [[Candida] railenensis]
MAKRQLENGHPVDKRVKKVEFSNIDTFEPEKVSDSVDVSVPSSEESEDEDEESEGEDENPASKKNEVFPHGKPSKKQRKQLSAQEIQVARETAELFKSNIFKLQIDELIKEVKLKESHVAKIEKVLHRLHDLISQVPATNEPLTLEQAESKFASSKKKVAIPWPEPKPTKANYKFAYLPPQDVSLVGSFGLKTGINSNTNNYNMNSIDIALTMPSELFQPKDYLNYRAFYKRSFYLAWLVEHLIPLSKRNHLPVKISYHFLNGDVLCPVLKLESIHTDNEEDLHFHKTKFTINLVVGFPFGIFDAKKVLPDKNCIRIDTTEKGELPATPIYNSSLLSSTSYDYYLKFLYTSKKSAEAFKDACILGRLWLMQRGLSSSFNDGGFGHFEFAILMSALLQGGGVNGNKILLHGFSSYQLFKGTIKYLATQDLNSGYLSFSSLIGESSNSKYSSEGFNTPTIFDKNIKLNVLWKMTPSSYQYLRQKAIETLVLLNDVVKDRFDPILLSKSNINQLKYDLVASLTFPEEIAQSFGAIEKIMFITLERWLRHKIYLILKTGLGDRVHGINIKVEKETTAFGINKRKPSASTNNKFIIGLTLNPEECEKLVTKGPNQTDTEEGSKFRSFWGNRASLRRFKDGTIQHCVVWQQSNKKGEPIVLSIMKYVLDAKLLEGISEHLYSESSLFNGLLPTPLSGGNNGYNLLRNSLDGFSRVLSNLDGVPLQIKSLSPGASPALRYTSLLQPVPFATASPDFWNEIILQFESSTKWPDEINSLEKTKSAMLLKFCELLEDTVYKAFITKDDFIPFNFNVCCLNILTPEGFGFKMRILTERDEILYLRAIENATPNEKAIVQDTYLRFNQKYIGSIKHTRTITSLSHHFHYYSSTVRIFKHWLDSHLLLKHMNDELIELIALKPFVDPAPYSIPHSTETGFLSILNFLSTWNWKEDPVILDLVKSQTTIDELTPEEELKQANKLTDRLTIPAYRIIESNFQKIRKVDPNGIKTQLFIGSKDDPSGILWSNELTLPIASRLTALARLSITLIKQQQQSQSEIDESTISLIFTPALKDYDFTIKVKTNSLTSSSGILPANKFKNLIGTESSFPDDICGSYDLVQEFYKELSKMFGNIIIFSTKKFTGLSSDGASNVIAGLFVPATNTKKKFRVGLGLNVKPIDKEECIINKEAIFNQINLLGGDLVQSIKHRK